MGINSQEAIKKLKALMDQVDQPLKKSFQNLHQGFLTETLERFLKAREYDVSKAHKMLVDCLKWRVENEIDKILRKPIFPADVYRAVRDSQLVGLSGYSKEGLPVFAIGVGLSTLDKANVNDYVQSHIQINEYRDRVVLPSASKKYGRSITTCVKILDMTGLKLSALGNVKLLTILSTIDDLNYPERTTAYYIVNAPYVFSSCWKVVKPLLHERTKRKIQVLPGCGRDELLKIMDYSSLPHFCKRESSLSSRSSSAHQGGQNCYSLDQPFHQQLYNYIKQQSLMTEAVEPIRKGSFHVNLQVPVSKSKGAAKTIESELRKYGSGLSDTLIELEIM
ncbi:phosphatidylinositol/phosphatidylcholine transfer protein SFH9-like [Cucurbita pepo subsp. pepo]|uniref:phosphatidylinositol/phosphatidylcholine transfer protein SFH9-like n=1 Tax=Cucurbita pepo subsp. pepo TaxID=3664 RepID=UPI000C9D47A4|nr:phosphatidylinositol/phosphatidylcholine transfer protein SFH9-like [Cucurbita pepo subsp. pepo]